MTFVLQQIRPPGKSARAHEATFEALATAAVNGGIEYGPYLEWFDPNARDGFGDEGWTNDIKKAKRFHSFGEAMACWKTESTLRPLRDDGAPNRPLTAYSVSPVRVD